MKYKPGTVLQGRYRIIELIGQGGFGEVYKAYAMHLSMPVALKHNLDRRLIAQEQFQREAKLLAKLRHPNLPRVTDHFIVGTGEQCLVMDYIPGKNLVELVKERGPLPEREVLGYALQVSAALEYLHTQTPPVIHRDIKPDNIIISPEGRAMLVDFGIFKRFDLQRYTTQGAVGVTPGYSPLEQYRSGETDARSDIYALGATLYTLLTGQAPPESKALKTKIESLRPLRELNPAISEPMARAISQAMALEQKDRLQTIAEFRMQLQVVKLYWETRTPPVKKHDPTGTKPRQTPMTVAEWAKAALAFLFVVATVFLAGRWLWGAITADSTAVSLSSPIALSPDNADGMAVLDQWGQGVVNQIAYSPDGRKLAVASSYAVSLFEAESLEYVDKHWVEKAATSVAFAPDSQHLAAGLQDGRILLWSSWKETPLTLSGHSGLVTSLAFTTNGQRLLSGSSDGSVRLWEVDGGTQTLVAENIGEVNAVAASPDGSWLAAAGENGALHLWNARSVTLVSARRVNDKKALALAFSPDSTELAISGEEGVVYLVRVADGVVTHTLPTQPFPVHALAFLPDAETLTLALGQANGSLSLWTPGEGGARPLVPSAHAGSINTVAFAPGGRTLASSSGNDTVRLWRVADGAKLAETDQYFGWVHDLAFAPDGSHLAAALSNRRVARLSLTEGNDLPSLIGHIEAVRGVAFAPNGLAVVSGGEDKVARVWESATAELLYTLSVPDMTEVNSVAVAPDGATAASGSSDGAVRLWRVGDGALLAMLPGMASPVWCVAFSPDGGRLAAGLENGSVMVWTLVDRNSRAFKLDGEGAVRGVAFSPDGATLAAAWDGGSVDLWSMADDSHRPLPAEARPTSLAFSPDGQLLVVGLSDGADAGHFRLWRVADGTLLRDIDAHRGAVAAVAFSADGKLIATGGMDGAVLLWGVVSN